MKTPVFLRFPDVLHPSSEVIVNLIVLNILIAPWLVAVKKIRKPTNGKPEKKTTKNGPLMDGDLHGPKNGWMDFG